MLMCQSRFISCNKCTTLVEEVDNEEGWGVGGQSIYEKSLYLLLNISVNLKLL